MPSDDPIDWLQKKPEPPKDPEFEKLETKLYVRQLAERDELVKQQRLEAERLGASKELEQRHRQELARITERFEKERERLNLTKPGASPAPPEFTAKAPFDQDPEFKKLMRDLQLRQEQEHNKLRDQQTQQRIEYGRKEGVTREMLEENYKRQLQDREALSKKHGVEMSRHIREYHDAKVILTDMREKEKQQTLEDAPKRTR